MTTSKSSLIHKIDKRAARIAVIGMGYVGLPLALAFCARRFRVIGCDTDHERIATLRFGRSPFAHIKSNQVAEFTDSEALTFADLSGHPTACTQIPHADIYIICVPTPLDAKRYPDLSMVDSAFAKVAETLHTVTHSTLVILESTVAPGTTQFMAAKHLELGLEMGGPLVAYSPEREDPGNPKFHTSNIPKLVGGCTEDARDVACALYAAMLHQNTSVVPVADPAIAEMAKLWENTFRQINIAAVNELKTVCLTMGIDVHRVIDAATTKPFGFMEFRPGPGVGGHCIPVDPLYLANAANRHGVAMDLVEVADAINCRQPYDIARAVRHNLPRGAGVEMGAARIVVLGVAYKPHTEDTRESPAYALYDALLTDSGAAPKAIDWADALVKQFRVNQANPRGTQIERASLTDGPLLGYDCAVIMCDQKLAYEELLGQIPVVIDACGALRLFNKSKFQCVRAA